jgi:hypothetical protein
MYNEIFSGSQSIWLLYYSLMMEADSSERMESIPSWHGRLPKNIPFYLLTAKIYNFIRFCINYIYYYMDGAYHDQCLCDLDDKENEKILKYFSTGKQYNLLANFVCRIRNLNLNLF